MSAIVEPYPAQDSQEPAPDRGRALIAQRLAEIVAWPATRIAPHERQLAGDILIGLLRSSGVELRRRCAERLVQVVDAPKLVLRYLARDEISVAQPLLDASPALDDVDLIATIRAGGPAHWLAIARRRGLSETVTEALIQTADRAAIEALLRNVFARISAPAMDQAVALSRTERSLPPLLLLREEMKPAQGLTLFWWANSEARLAILRRFAVDRAVLLQEVADLFSLARDENWTDAEARQALHFIERRQRNRAAAARSPYQSLENAVLALAEKGASRALIIEISTLAGLKPVAGARILGDAGGEPLAVLAKAVGLKRDLLAPFWRGLGRSDDASDSNSAFARTLFAYDTLANAKAQTVLRYWNWSLTSDAPAAGVTADPLDAALEFAPARRSASLVLGWRS